MLSFRKQADYFCIVDTETTINGHVADFAAVVVDRKGRIVTQCAVLTPFFNSEKLFYNQNIDSLWSENRLTERESNYRKMLDSGQRRFASIEKLNEWLATVADFQPILTAYFLQFDQRACKLSGIELPFNSRFCLWQAACKYIAGTRKYRQFILKHHFFNAPTTRGNMSMKTNAETMMRYISECPEFIEKHEALSDIVDCELPILLRILKNRRATKRALLSDLSPYRWQDWQVRKHYTSR